MQMNRRARDAELAYEATPRELSQVTRKIESVLDAIENGIFTASTRERLIELEQRKLRLERVDTMKPIPRLHPAIADVYRAKVVKLQEALNEPATRGEAAEILRSLLEELRLTPRESEELSAELYGAGAAIWKFGEPERANRAGAAAPAQFSMVAGEGFEPPTLGL